MDIFLIDASKYNEIDFSLLENFGYKVFTGKTKQYVHCLTYYLLDSILFNRYNIKNRKIIFKNKKPMLCNNEKNFSISHSHNYIAIAVSDYKCGIDIEKIINRDYIKISERMGFSSGTLIEFYQNWTLFEAKYKLASEIKKHFSNQIDGFMFSAVSENKDEVFNLIENYTLS